MKEYFRFLALTIRMGYEQRGSIMDYWSRDEHQTTHFLPTTMVGDLFLHILKYLHFAENEYEILQSKKDFGSLEKHLTL
jgi:hypothetical protein